MWIHYFFFVLHINDGWRAGFPDVRMLLMKNMPVYNINGIRQIPVFCGFFFHKMLRIPLFFQYLFFLNLIFPQCTP